MNLHTPASGSKNKATKMFSQKKYNKNFNGNRVKQVKRSNT